MGCLLWPLRLVLRIFFPNSVVHQAITQAEELKVSLRRRLIRYLFDLVKGRKNKGKRNYDNKSAVNSISITLRYHWLMRKIIACEPFCFGGHYDKQDSKPICLSRNQLIQNNELYCTIFFQIWSLFSVSANYLLRRHGCHDVGTTARRSKSAPG